MRVRVYGDGALCGDFDSIAQWELAFKVAKAISKSGRVAVFEEEGKDGVTYVGPNYARSSERIEWPARAVRPVGRPRVHADAEDRPKGPKGRPKLPGSVVKVRLLDDTIDQLRAIGSGDLAFGIERLLARQVDTR